MSADFKTTSVMAVQAGTLKHMPLISNLGLDIEPLIAADGGVGGLAALIKNPTPFISAAVAAALKNNYSGSHWRDCHSAEPPSFFSSCFNRDVEGTSAQSQSRRRLYSGYNFDNELRGREDDKSWSFLDKYAAGWMAFLDKFADALWKRPANPPMRCLASLPPFRARILPPWGRQARARQDVVGRYCGLLRLGRHRPPARTVRALPWCV